ncbi:MAG: hypothetical protein GW941_01645 [Candidatus Pacebacteria bacterium]|nr:hypothetical protein [Candidatus Paceibacterota bacterium]
MSSTILICNNQQDIIKTLREVLKVKIENNPDLYQINTEKESIKIKQIREIGEQLVYSPSKEKYKTFILYNFEKTTIPAQNAFLKSLEEHPNYIQFILQCNNLNGVLETIQSRCEIKKCSNKEDREDNNLSEERKIKLNSAWRTISTGSYADIIELCSDYKNREEAIAFINSLISFLHTENSLKPDKNKIIALQNFTQCLDQLEQNSNVLLTLEHHIFSIKSRF